MDAASIREHMEVVGKDGGHVGTVDHVEGKQVKLTRSDPAAGGEHHFIGIDTIAKVDSKVHLNRASKDLLAEWKTH
ncbi:MAG: DUF2171 domain-containing protein [Rhizobiales bacterium]|nr:DUF2171 domain-containing protein [Hyphomicrobiales bacterium]